MLLVLAASTFSVTRGEGTDFLRGDANLDGAADAADIPALLTYAVQGDGTSRTGAAEAALLARYVDGYLSTLPLDDGEQLPATPAQTQDALSRLAAHSFSAVYDTCVQSIGSFRLTTYARIASQSAVFQKAADDFNAAFDAGYDPALQIACRDLRQMNIPLIDTEKVQSGISWKAVAAMYMAYGDRMPAMLAASMSASLLISDDGARFAYSVPDYETMFSQGTRAQLLTAKFTFAYLNTVFTDDGTLAPADTPQLSEEYLATLAHPLPGRMIKNGWCLPRSNRTRLHMGTDIRALRNTPIQSVTDGTVLYIGYAAIPGNYVIVRDPYGYEYHYYHMVKLSDYVSEGEQVEQGQVIGFVGSTGNSDANHLHLAILSPDYRYYDPYEVFRQAGIGPLRPSA